MRPGAFGRPRSCRPVPDLAVGSTAEITIESDTYQITIEDGIGLTAPRTTSRDIKRHKASHYPPG